MSSCMRARPWGACNVCLGTLSTAILHIRIKWRPFAVGRLSDLWCVAAVALLLFKATIQLQIFVGACTSSCLFGRTLSSGQELVRARCAQ